MQQKGISRFTAPFPYPPTPRPRKVTVNLNLICKNILSEKTNKKKEQKRYFQLLQKKSNCVSSRKQPHAPSECNLQSPVDVEISNYQFKQKRDCKTNGKMGKCKSKAIQEVIGMFTYVLACSGIFKYPDIIRYIQPYSGIIQANSKLRVILVYSELYSKSWHIQNQRHIQNPGSYIQNSVIFRTRDIFRILGYSEPWHIQNRGHILNVVKHL